MEILDLKLAGITLWTWCGAIAFIWLIYRFGDLILNFLSIAVSTAVVLIAVALLVLTIIGIPQLIYDGDWLPLLGLAILPAGVAIFAALDRIKYRPGSIGWHIYPRRREPPTAPK
jgi:hypothetical protein